jgi:hypothetical protein
LFLSQTIIVEATCRNLIPKSGTIWESGNRCQNLEPDTGTRSRFFWKSKNLEIWNRGPPNLGTIWKQSGTDLETKKMEKTHLEQFKKPPNGWLLKLWEMFFPKNLALDWHWFGNDFVKAVPKIFYFSHCQIYEFVGCPQNSTT